MKNTTLLLLEHPSFITNEQNHDGEHTGNGENDGPEAENAEHNNSAPPRTAGAGAGTGTQHRRRRRRVPKQPLSLSSVCISLILIVSALVTFTPVISDATIALRDAIPAGSKTACDWHVHIGSLATHYPSAGFTEFADSHFIPPCAHDGNAVLGTSSPFDAATKLINALSHGMTHTYSYIAWALSMDDTGVSEVKDVSTGKEMISSVDILHAFAEFWVQSDTEALVRPFSVKTWNDILHDFTRVIRVTLFQQLQSYIKMSHDERAKSHEQGLACFLSLICVVILGACISVRFAEDPIAEAEFRLVVVVLLLTWIPTCNFWNGMVENFELLMDHTGFNILGVSVLLKIAFWLGTKCRHPKFLYRFGVHLATMSLVLRAFFLSTMLKETFPAVYFGYCLCALFLFLRLIVTLVRSVHVLYFDLWDLDEMNDLLVFLVDTFPRTHPNFVDFYAVLGVAPWATDAELRRAYRALARATHPDRNPAADATERFQVIGAAGEELMNHRQRYDAFFGFPKSPMSSAVDRLVIRTVQFIVNRILE